MTRLRFLLPVLLCFAAPSHAQVLLLTGAGKGAGIFIYTGAGDVVSGAVGWWGLRAYNSADRGNALINVCNVADVACADMSSNAVTGALTITTIGGSDCSIVVCTIKTFYDRSGNAKNLTQATIANRFVLTLNCAGLAAGLPCATALGSASQCYVGPSNSTVASPYTVVYLAKRTATFTAYDTVLSESSDHSESGFGNAADSAYMAGTAVSVNVAGAINSQWKVLQNNFVTGVGASTLTVNSTDTAVSIGTAAFTGTFVMGVWGNAGPACGTNQFFTGTFTEGGFWPSTFSGANRTAMFNNLLGYWGF